jgi:methyl coenzyme M reductase subunit D
MTTSSAEKNDVREEWCQRRMMSVKVGVSRICVEISGSEKISKEELVENCVEICGRKYGIEKQSLCKEQSKVDS